MSTAVRTVYIELRASAEKLRADMADANKAVITVGKGGEEAGKSMARGMDQASVSVRKIGAEATEATLAIAGGYHALAAAAARYGVVTVTNTASTEGFMTSLRALRIAASAAFPKTLGSVEYASVSVALGILIEKTAQLTLARAKLIDQQALIAAKGGISIGSAERADTLASITGSGASAETLRSLQASLHSEDPDALVKIARDLAAIADPAKRAELAVKLFGDNAGKALEQLDGRFIIASEAANRFGLGLTEVGRNQIVQFRRDVEGLSDPFKTLVENVRAASASFDEDLEQMAGAADDLAHKLNRALGSGGNTFLQNFTGARPQGPPALSLKELAARRGAGSSSSLGDVADGLFAQSQLSHFRQSQTLEGQQSAQHDAQARADRAYSSLDADATKRKANPNDSTLLTAEQRFALTNEQQSAAALAGAIGERVAALQQAVEAQKLADQKAEELANFQSGASDRLNALYQSATTQDIKDPTARVMFEGRVNIGRDADRTSPEEKAGRADIATQQLRQAAIAEQGRLAKEVLDQLAAANSFALKAFGDRLKIDTENQKKAAEDQVKEDSANTAGLRDTGEHAARMATIRSGPGGESALAGEILDIKLKTVAAERAIVDAHRESYTVEQGDVEDARLNRESSDAEAEARERIAEIQKQRAQEAINAGGAYQQRLRALSQEVDALNAIKVTEGNIRDIEAARKVLNDQILQNAVQQKLAIGDLQSGWDAFWLEMQEQAEKPGKILYDGMNDALNKISGDLTKVVTGQHKQAGFGKHLESVGRSMTGASIKSIMQKGLGSLGAKLGIHAPAGKPDGTTGNPYNVVIQGQRGQTPGLGAPGGPSSTGGSGSVGGVFGRILGALGIGKPQTQPPAATSGQAGKPDGTEANPYYVIEENSKSGSSGGGALAGLGGLGGAGGGMLASLMGGGGSGGAATEAVSSSISFMAGGGDADPGKVYGVAEAGEAELISPKNSSRITPVSKLGGTNHYSYSIDARGADLGAENRVARAIEFAHNSAVSNSVRASSERAKRTPKRS